MPSSSQALQSIPLAISIEVSPGELADKISILEIKSARIDDPVKLKNVRYALECLLHKRAAAFPDNGEMTRLQVALKEVNEALWDIEDAIRACEAAEDFGPRFISLARSVYRTNDRRAALKKEIDLLLGSPLVEEKSYRAY